MSTTLSIYSSRIDSVKEHCQQIIVAHCGGTVASKTSIVCVTCVVSERSYTLQHLHAFAHAHSSGLSTAPHCKRVWLSVLLMAFAVYAHALPGIVPTACAAPLRMHCSKCSVRKAHLQQLPLKLELQVPALGSNLISTASVCPVVPEQTASYDGLGTWPSVYLKYVQDG
jgi:hypothetical protein